MKFQIVESSKEAIEAPEEQSSYPFDALEVGQSFLVAMAANNGPALRTAASRASKKLERKFRVVAWSDLGKFEVARLA